MASKVAHKRLQKEYLSMQKSPPPFIWACPEEKNILDWHFIIRGPPDSVYAGGEYHGLIWFPNDYPFKPPDVKLFTPSGRFEVGHKICMSMTSYHPSTWNAAWSVATILTGLLSFMLSDEITAGAVRTTNEQKKEFAKQSHAFNLNNRKFRDIFPTYATPQMTDLPDMGNQPSSKPQLSPSDMSTPASSAPITRINTPAPPDLLHTALKSHQIPERSPLTAGGMNEAQEKERREGEAATVDVRRDRKLERRDRWWLSWKMVLVVIFIAVIGRLSKLMDT